MFDSLKELFISLVERLIHFPVKEKMMGSISIRDAMNSQKNYEKAKKRGFVCGLCGSKPPSSEFVFAHSSLCATCYFLVKLSHTVIIVIIITVFLVEVLKLILGN